MSEILNVRQYRWTFLGVKRSGCNPDKIKPGLLVGHRSVGVAHTLFVHSPYRQSLFSTQVVMTGAGVFDNGVTLLRQGTLESPTMPVEGEE